ncbi:MAG TPA: hypothetical protein VME23_17935 [Terracidiphilus sp.]|nr:hypothetical protein [Terracidiphilus sp.]
MVDQKSKRKQPIHRCTPTKADQGTGFAHEDHIEAGARAESFPETVTTPVAAKIVGRSADTLKRWRYEGVGPEYIVFRHRVRYDIRVLTRFNEENTRMPSVRAAMEAEREDF